MNSRVWADLALVLDPGKMQDGLQHPGGLVWLKVRLWIRKPNWVWIKVESPLHRPAKREAEANFAGLAEFDLVFEQMFGLNSSWNHAGFLFASPWPNAASELRFVLNFKSTNTPNHHPELALAGHRRIVWNRIEPLPDKKTARTAGKILWCKTARRQLDFTRLQ